MKKLFTSLGNFLINPASNPKGTQRQDDISCVAIDQSGVIGSIYNRYEDTIAGKLNFKGKTQPSPLSGQTACHLYHGRTGDSQNLLRTVGIDPSLRLSIMFGMVQPTGLASIINYPQRIDKQTRFLCFHHQTRMESGPAKLIKEIEAKARNHFDASTTHIISKIVYGIQAVVVLQLPPDLEGEIDALLERICENLTRYECFTQVTEKEQHLLDRITSARVYSNIPTITSMTHFLDVVRELFQIRNDSANHRRMIYVLSSCQLRKAEQHADHPTSSAFESPQIKLVENDLLHHWGSFRVLQLRLEHELPELLQGKLEDRLTAHRESYSEIKKLSDNLMRQIGDLLIRARKNEAVIGAIGRTTSSEDQELIDDGTRRLTFVIDNLTAKGQLIRQLQDDTFEYWDVSRLGIDEKCSDQLVEDRLFKNDPGKLIFCANDDLKNKSSEQWTTLHTRMVKQRQENPQLRLMYADFTYTRRVLDRMVIVLPRKKVVGDRQLDRTASTRKSKHKTPLRPADDYINILLLGESGVGKSTFINAFANYLRYGTLSEAEKSEPFVIIPVSFLTTINDTFDEKLVKFGEPDPNEDHNHSGQSVTQQCRSYVFELSSGKKLRIIDTPGFGDTRGLDQDELNMETIFSFLHHFPYINGICFLLKPNVRQLNPFLYSCFTQLFRFFGESVRDRLIFCFTNARSTFFAPGDTAPTLHSFFQSFPVKQIPFDRKNTFCFDSESFRYLVSLQNAVTFKEVERQELESSWRQSVEQSQRFEGYLCEGLSPYRKNIEWQSMHETRFQIESMVRPILEAVRNILRNILLYSTHSTIELRATCVQQPTVICYSAGLNMGKFGPYGILLDHLHPALNQCTLSPHAPVAYRLEHDYQADRTNESPAELKQQRALLCEVSAKLARFLLQTVDKQDPFLSGFTRMIKEEELICNRDDQNSMNQQLKNELEKLKAEYEQLLVTRLNGDDTPLPPINEVIRSIDHVHVVQEQLNAIRDYDQLFVATNETNFSSYQTRL